jgi:hypothetical protein
MATPKSVTVFSYQVGFGDCFLLKFSYAPPERDRFVLIDFGTTGLPKNVADNHLLNVAKDIQAKCGGSLDAVVATHRHADHISGFATRASGNGPGDIIRTLRPKVVVQPWTEDLQAATNATGPSKGFGQQLRSARQALDTMHGISRSVLDYVARNPKALSQRVAAQLRFLGEDNLKNDLAVRNLATMAKNVYAYHGSNSGLGRILPGVKTHVLGPPTLDQSKEIAKQRTRDVAEYWHVKAARVSSNIESTGSAGVLFPNHIQASARLPMNVRWIARRVKEARGDQLLQIVRSLDKQLNNTSLILLFEVGDKKLLFPGDAQIENWRYALDKPKYQAMLADVDVYKVGHHGSLNATPRSMWNKFNKRGRKGGAGRLKTLLSTMAGKHGHDHSDTEVPRRTLMEQLKSQTDLHNTQDYAEGQLCEAVLIRFT